MSGAELPIAAAGVDAALAGTALGAGGAAAAAPGIGASLAGMGSAIGNTAIGSTSALGSGLSLGAGGVGLAAPAGALTGAQAAMIPGMEGAIGSGLAATASQAPSLATPFASSAVQSSHLSPFTVGDAGMRLGSGLRNLNAAQPGLRMMQQPQPAMQAPQSRPIFQGEAPMIAPQSLMPTPRNLLLQRMASQNGLL